MRIMKYFIALAIAVIFSACTSMKSIKNPEHTDDKDGLSYFLPKKDILIQFSVKQPSPPKSDSPSTKKDTSNKKSNSTGTGTGTTVKITEVTIGTTSAYPDFSEQYIINYSTNLIGQNTLNLGVNKLGLLTSAKSETESKINESFRALAKAGGMITGALSKDDQGKKTTCDEIGDYTFIYPVPDVSSLEINNKNYSDFTPTKDSEALTADACGYKIEITRLLSDIQKKKLIKHSKNRNKLYAGVFYRQEIPYRVTVKKGPYSHAAIVSSPTASNSLFLPIKGTLFADNKADFSFSDGIPTMNKQIVGSELLALAQLPADIIEGYFEGVGALFKHISGVKETQSGNIKHDFDTLRYELCIAAINANNTDLITELQCTAK